LSPCQRLAAVAPPVRSAFEESAAHRTSGGRKAARHRGRRNPSFPESVLGAGAVDERLGFISTKIMSSPSPPQPSAFSSTPSVTPIRWPRPRVSTIHSLEPPSGFSFAASPVTASTAPPAGTGAEVERIFRQRRHGHIVDVRIERAYSLFASLVYGEPGAGGGRAWRNSS